MSLLLSTAALCLVVSSHTTSSLLKRTTQKPQMDGSLECTGDDAMTLACSGESSNSREL